MAGKFVIKTTRHGEYTFNLKAGNGEIVLTASESYTSLEGCRKGIESVRTNAASRVEDQTRPGFEKLPHPKFEIYRDRAGGFRFRLKARNGQNIGKSEGYRAKAACLNGIASVGRRAPAAPVVVDQR